MEGPFEPALLSEGKELAGEGDPHLLAIIAVEREDGLEIERIGLHGCDDGLGTVLEEGGFRLGTRMLQHGECLLQQYIYKFTANLPLRKVVRFHCSNLHAPKVRRPYDGNSKNNSDLVSPKGKLIGNWVFV